MLRRKMMRLFSFFFFFPLTKRLKLFLKYLFPPSYSRRVFVLRPMALKCSYWVFPSPKTVKLSLLNSCPWTLSLLLSHSKNLTALSVGSPSPWVAIKKIERVFFFVIREGLKSFRSITLLVNSAFSASSESRLEYLAAVPD